MNDPKPFDMVGNLTWMERVGAISVNPDMANLKDVAIMSAQLYDLLGKEVLTTEARHEWSGSK